jgi:hypothetical protein
MNIDVEVEDFFALLGEDFAAKGNVVYVAKAGGKFGVGVVKAARRIERDIDFAVEDELCRCNGSPDCQNRVFIYSFEDGAIGGAKPHIEGIVIPLAF